MTNFGNELEEKIATIKIKLKDQVELDKDELMAIILSSLINEEANE